MGITVGVTINEEEMIKKRFAQEKEIKTKRADSRSNEKMPRHSQKGEKSKEGMFVLLTNISIYYQINQRNPQFNSFYQMNQRNPQFNSKYQMNQRNPQFNSKYQMNQRNPQLTLNIR